MKIKYFIPLFLLIITFSCRPSPGTERVEFLIRNECFNDIHITFVNTQTSDSDNVTVVRHETFTIHSVTLPPYKHTNWFTDFNVQIHGITNFEGDTINFDPNIPAGWIMYETDLYTTYSMQIDEVDF